MAASGRIGKHKNVVHLLHGREVRVRMPSDRGRKTIILVLELLRPATPLNDAIAKRESEPFDTRKVALDIAEGLCETHRRGYAHRDVKSPNVLLSMDPRQRRLVAKLCDYSSAAPTEDALPTVAPKEKESTRSSGAMGILESLADAFTGSEGWRPVGSLLWMAPEMMSPPEEGSALSLDKAAYGKCDVYSFGVVLWELLAGRLPWVEEGISDATTGKDELRRRVVQEGERLPVPTDGVGESLLKLLDDCFLEDPTQRPSMQEVLRRLKATRNADWGPRVGEAAAAASAIDTKETLLASGAFTIVEASKSKDSPAVVLTDAVVTLGRSRSCTFGIRDGRASRTHAEMRFVLDEELWPDNVDGTNGRNLSDRGDVIEKVEWAKVKKNADGSLEFTDSPSDDGAVAGASPTGYFIVCDNSSNGTSLNGNRIRKGMWRRLATGDTLKIGRTQLEFLVDEDALRKALG